MKSVATILPKFLVMSFENLIVCVVKKIKQLISAPPLKLKATRGHLSYLISNKITHFCATAEAKGDTRSSPISHIYPLFTKITLVLALTLPLTLHSQDVEALLKTFKNKPIQVSGGVSTNHIYYYSDGISPRRNNPYTYYAQGNLNFNIYNKVSLPFSFSYSNAVFDYTYPQNQQSFNQFGLSPKYKWITLHGGYRSMTFSPYTLNGHIFLGGGAELAPSDKVDIALMYGRLQKAVEFDTLADRKSVV